MCELLAELGLQAGCSCNRESPFERFVDHMLNNGSNGMLLDDLHARINDMRLENPPFVMVLQVRLQLVFFLEPTPTCTGNALNRHIHHEP